MPEQRPHITVATVVERDGQLLMVKELADGALVYNQPAGHLEVGESLLEAAVRETLEETAWRVQVTALLGIYQYRSELNGITYIRVCFVAKPETELLDYKLDPAIVEAAWLTPAELERIAEVQPGAMRSPLVMAVIKDFQAGKSFPLSILSQF